MVEKGTPYLLLKFFKTFEFEKNSKIFFCAIKKDLFYLK